MKLCSNEFFDFFMAIPDSIDSIEELSGYIAKAVAPVCELCGIGKIELCLNNPKSPYEERIKDNITMLYCHPEGYDDSSIDNCVDNIYTTHSGGTAEVIFYPRKQTVWEDDDLECLKFLSNIINMLCGKAGLAKLAQISAVTDALTGIANADGIDVFIADCCERNVETAYTAIYVDIKDFSYFNKQFGVSYADVILKKYAHCLRDFMRKDEICGRLNDDNFLTIIKNNRVDKFLDFISDVQLRLNIDDIANTFNIQAKICVYPIAEKSNISTIIHNISIALNAEKDSSDPDRVWFKPSMLDDTMHEREITGNFSKAIALKEFDVYYQPKLHLDSGKLCGCEALVRWNRNSGLLSPADFLHVLEKDGTVCALDLYVLEEVCIRLRAWLDANITPVRVSINFSKVHLHNRFLAEDIMKVLNKYAIPPQYIEIELTESSGYDDFTSLFDFIKRIKSYGIHTSIDNFGTGYASLKLMSDLDINVIKLDRSFVTGITDAVLEDIDASFSDGRTALKRAKNNEIVMKSIIETAHALGIKVICSGVENEQQEKLLKRHGCDMGQGFLYDKALPHDIFAKKLQGIS